MVITLLGVGIVGFAGLRYGDLISVKGNLSYDESEYSECVINKVCDYCREHRG